MNKIAVVIPTTLSRPKYFPMAYHSVMAQEGDFELEVFVGCPEHVVEDVAKIAPKAVILREPRTGGLGSKLDSFLKIAAQESDFLAWLGDDDTLTIGSLAVTSQLLSAHHDASMAFGACDYIDEQGQIIFTNKSGPWASGLLHFGPQLIPQPGSLMRSSSYLAAGGLVDDFKLAFDFDLFLRLKKLGRMLYSPRTLAQFRWHPTSLSVKHRFSSAAEASKVRRRHYRGISTYLWPLWEPLTIGATWLAGKIANSRVKKRMNS